MRCIRLPEIVTALACASGLLLPACSSSSSPGATPWTGDGGAADSAASGGDGATADDGGDAAAVQQDGSPSGEEGGPEGGGAGPGVDGGGDAAVLDAGAGGGAEAGVMQAVMMTFYGWADNSPPGNAIAYPKSGGFPTVHEAAGGTGTYDDPISYATDKLELPVGTRVYASVIEKYLVMEDDCGQCDTDWSGSKAWHIDVWMNSSGAEDSAKLIACEDQWTQTTTTIEIDPPPGRTVTTAPLFDPNTNVCRTTP